MAWRRIGVKCLLHITGPELGSLVITVPADVVAQDGFSEFLHQNIILNTMYVLCGEKPSFKITDEISPDITVFWK